MVAVALCDAAVVAHDVAFGVRGEKAHPAGTGILNTGVQPKGGFAYACRADHQHVNVAGVHHRRGVAFAPDDDALRKSLAVFAGRSLSVFGLLTPLLWGERDVLIHPSLLAFGHPAGGSVLTVTDRLGFDVVEAVNIRQQGDPAEDAEHDGSDDN